MSMPQWMIVVMTGYLLILFYFITMDIRKMIIGNNKPLTR
ncbi:MAG: hypothetical protein ABW138_14650 [Candidatus Thiodiazotropha sp. 4PDIVS1]